MRGTPNDELKYLQTASQRILRIRCWAQFIWIMKVYATFNQEVHIEPKQVIEKLIKQEIGDERYNWIVERFGKFYHIHEESAGCHSVDIEDEISKEKYEYVKALQLVLKRLELNYA